MLFHIPEPASWYWISYLHNKRVFIKYGAKPNQYQESCQRFWPSYMCKIFWYTILIRCHKVQCLLFSNLLPVNITIKMYNIIILPVFYGSLFQLYKEKQRFEMSENRVWQENGQDCIMISFIIFTLHLTLTYHWWWKVEWGKRCRD